MVIIQWWSAEKYGAAVFCARAECWDASLRITLVLGMALLPLYHLPAGMQVFHTCRHVCFHMCLRVFLLSSGQIFPLDVSHKPQRMQDCSFGCQGTRSVLELRVSILVLWAPLLQVRCWLLPFKEHRLGDIPLTKHAAFFPTETQPFQRNMSNTVWNTLSLQSTGRARSRWDIFQTLGKNKAS